jgi:hypothetical protein
MAELRIPSVQHLARNWRDDSNGIARALVHLALNPPFFNYNPLYGAVRDLLVFDTPYEQVVEGIRRIKREKVRNNLLSVLPLIRDHFAGVSPTFFQTPDKRFYPVGRGLMVPFESPMIYGVRGQLYFPWFSFWRRNPLTNERLSLFVTLVYEILMQDPDLEQAKFEILDFSCPDATSDRVLRVLDARDIPRLTDARKTQMLEIFAEGYFRAVDELKSSSPSPSSSDDDRPGDDNVRQPELFD